MNEHRSVESIAASERPLPQRVVKWATVAQADGTLDGVLIHSDELERLSNWCCKWDVFHHHQGESDDLRKGLIEAGGACDGCRSDAIFLLQDCPYIEMNRSAEMTIEYL